MSRLHLAQIQVHHLHNRRFDQLKLEDLSEQLTVVYGPNAAGKTVLAHAASRLFSTREKKSDPFDDVVAVIDIDGVKQAIALRESPHWPQSIRPNLYHLSIPDLLGGPDEKDQEQIRQALAGGLDLNRISVPSTGRLADKRNKLNQCIQTLRDKRRKADELQRDELQLPQQRAALAEALKAAGDLNIIQRWEEAAGHETAAAALQTQLDQLEATHPGIAQQGEQAANDIQQQRETYEQSRQQLRTAYQALRAFGGRRARIPLQAVDRSSLQTLRNACHTASGNLQQASIQSRRDQDAQRQAERWLEEHAPGLGRAELALSPADRQRLEALLEAAEEAGERARTLSDQCVTSAQTREQARISYQNAGGDPHAHPSAAPHTDAVQAIIGLDREINEAAGALQRAQEAQTKSAAELSAAQQGLPGIRAAAAEILQELQREPRIAALMDQFRELHERREAYTAVAATMEQEAARSRDRSESAKPAVQALRDWLRATPASGGPQLPMPPIITAAAVAVVSVVVALAVHPWAGVILAAVGLVAVMMLLLMRPGMAAAADDRRPQIAASLPDEWRPQKWNIESVAARLAEAVEAVQRSAAADHAALFARTRADGIDDQPARSALEQRRQLFTDAVGVEIGDGYALADFVARLDLLAKTEAESAARHQMLSTAQEHLDRLRGEREEAIGALGAPVETGAAAQQWAAALRQLIDAENAHAANERARDQATAAAEDTQRQLTDFFTRFNWPAEGDPQTARDGFDRWFELTSQLNDAEAAASRSRDDVQRLQEAIDTTRQQVRELLDRYRFPTEADPMDAVTSFLDWFTHTATLDTARDTTRQARRRLLQRLRNSGIPADQPLRQRVQIPAARQAAADDWRRLDRQKQTRLEQASAFRDTPGCHEVFQRRDLPTNPTATQLAAARERLQPLAASAEQLQRDIAGTETRLAEELKANDLHAAHTALATAVSDIDRWLAHTLLNKAKGAVIQWSTEAHRREARPGLIERANEWLGRFSNGRYGRLDVNGSVHVIDQLEASTQKRVDQLSTGTRAHLALAVRLAVIEESETSVRFPLLLDEVLAASDPDASDAIAKAIKQIAAERQVVVFTNQPDDVNLLREVFGPDLREKMLAATGPVAQAPPAAALQRANDVDDDPEGKLPIHTPLELWPPRLIAPLIPQLGASASNVRRAMEQLEPDARSRAALLIDTLEALRHEAAAAHRIIHWSDIEQQDWTEGAYREQIYQALVDSRGHSKTLLEKFCAIAGMRRDKKSACEKWLSDNGYLVDPLPLETLVKLAWARLPEDYPNRGLVAQGLAAVFAAFVSST